LGLPALDNHDDPARTCDANTTETQRQNAIRLVYRIEPGIPIFYSDFDRNSNRFEPPAFRRMEPSSNLLGVEGSQVKSGPWHRFPVSL